MNAQNPNELSSNPVTQVSSRPNWYADRSVYAGFFVILSYVFYLWKFWNNFLGFDFLASIVFPGIVIILGLTSRKKNGRFSRSAIIFGFILLIDETILLSLIPLKWHIYVVLFSAGLGIFLLLIGFLKPDQYKDSVENHRMHCPKCDKEQMGKFCEQCGYQLTSSSQIRPHKPKWYKDISLYALLFNIFAWVFVVSYFLWALNSIFGIFHPYVPLNERILLYFWIFALIAFMLSLDARKKNGRISKLVLRLTLLSMAWFFVTLFMLAVDVIFLFLG